MNAHIKRAKAAMALRPSFKLLRAIGTPTRVKDKVFEIKCLDCQNIELRNLEWITSKYGCRCTRGQKISETQSSTGEQFSKKWQLKRRKLRLISDYKTMHVRVDVECLRCHYVWNTAPTNLRHAGCPKCAPKLKRRKCLKEHGVEYSTQRPDVRAKTRRTLRQRYGVDCALQNRTLLNKMISSSYSRKSYQLGSRLVQVQGYEPYALDYIVNTKKINPKSIQCGTDSLPSIRYKYDGKQKVYHPDIFIPKLNLLIEVKSSYTYKRSLAKNQAKKKACIAAGYRFKFLIFKKNGDLHEDSDR